MNPSGRNDEQLDNLFILLRLGLEITTPLEEDLSQILLLNEDGWKTLLQISASQGVLGITVDGISRLFVSHYIKERPSWYYEAIAGVVLREERNKSQIQVLKELSHLWKSGKVQMMLLKGQANGLCYPKPNHRDCGDIDCYLMGNYKKGNDIIRNNGITVNESWDKHSVFHYKKEIIENHQFFINSLDMKWKVELEKKLLETLNHQEFEKFPESDILLPPTMFQAIFLTYHAMIHFIAGNLRLKQVIDWVMFLRANNSRLNWEEVLDTCDHFKMNRFLFIMNIIAQDLFQIRKISIINYEERKRLKKFLESIIYDEDFMYDSADHNRWHARLHYVKYVLSNRWKYNFMGISATKQLWLYVSSYNDRN